MLIIGTVGMVVTGLGVIASSTYIGVMFYKIFTNSI